jgi:hypothetical protein
MKILNRYNLHRLISITLWALLLACLPPHLLSAQDPAKPFSRLLEFAASEREDAAYCALEDFDESFYPQIHASNMDYLKEHPGIVEQIRSDLGEQTFEWHLKSLSHRQLYVSENRPEYIRLYEAYCRHAISEVLNTLELPNPYARIITLPENSRFPVESDGINALIVHDLTREYRSEYEFRAQSEKAVAIKLNGLYSTGEIGSYSSMLIFNENGTVDFTHDRYTIWQNHSKNPYTMLMTPVEETLHILLRKSTESAIKQSVEAQEGCSRAQAEDIVHSWICVEEAIVGGLVNTLLPPILEKEVGNLSKQLISQDLETKNKIAKYNHLEQGIRIVKSLGSKASLDLYLRDPAAFEALL